jgi:uncharacterized membrane protein YkvA (DUF1232 family)
MNSAQESGSDLISQRDTEIQPEGEVIEVKQSLLGRALQACRFVGQFARLLVGLMLDPRVEKKVKLFVAAVLAYIISPADFIPELLTGVFGMLDDLVLSAFALNVILNWVDPEIVKSHWHGKYDLLGTIQRIIKNAEVFVPDGVLKKIQNWIGSHSEKALHSSADA